jgi:hypothetical protein
MRDRAAARADRNPATRGCDRDEHEALERLLRYAKREAEIQERQTAALLIEAAIAALADGVDRRAVQ